MRLATCVLLVAALVSTGCGDDDDEGPSAQGVTTTTDAAACELSAAPSGQGASTDLVDVLCDGEPLTLDGQPAQLAYGGTVTHGDGLRCDGARLVVLTATSDDGVSYAATSITYEVDGTELVEVERGTLTIDATAEPETLDPYYRLDC